MQYDFLVDADGAPFELRMWGINLFTGGHFDDYRVRFTGYDAQPLKGAAFAIDKSACSVRCLHSSVSIGADARPPALEELERVNDSNLCRLSCWLKLTHFFSPNSHSLCPNTHETNT